MEEIWSLHSEYGDGRCCNYSPNSGYQDNSRAPSKGSGPLYCPDWGMPSHTTSHYDSNQRNGKTSQHQHHAETHSSHDLTLSTSRSFFIEQEDDLFSDFSCHQPDTELILLIQQLESERSELTVIESSRPDTDGGVGEWSHPSGSTSISFHEESSQLPTGNDHPTEAHQHRTHHHPATNTLGGGLLSESSSSSAVSPRVIIARQSSSSAKHQSRIKQIDLELSKLRRLLAMEERLFMTRQSTRSSKSYRGMSTSNAVGNSVSSDASTVSACGHSCPGSMQQPSLLLATISNLSDAGKIELTKSLAEQCGSRDECFELYQQNVIPILIRLIHDPMCGMSKSPARVRHDAGQILFKLVSCQADGKRGRREDRVMHWLEELRAYNTDILHPDPADHRQAGDEMEEGPPQSALINLKKYSTDEEFRNSICSLGGLNAVAEFIQCDFLKYDNTNSSRHVTMRQYACMILTNLAYGDGCNKALLCSSASFLATLVHLLTSSHEDLRVAVASVVRNISWRADVASKRNLRDSKIVSCLLRAAPQSKTEAGLGVVLSALSNLSAHNDDNRQEISAFEGALGFLVRNLQYKSTARPQSHQVQEYSGCVLRSVSSLIAVRPDYRKILRDHDCLDILVAHLRSGTMALVANACGILRNLSARCVEDQQRIWELGAVKLLMDLSRSTHELVASSSASAVINLQKAREGFHTIGRKGEERAGISRKIRANGRNGRLDDQIQSADDYDVDDVSLHRGVNSVPSSPMVANRAARINASYRSANNVAGNRMMPLPGINHRDQNVQLMASISRQVAGGRGSSHQVASPPLSPPKHSTNGSSAPFSHFTYHNAYSDATEPKRSWNNHGGDFRSPTEFSGFQDFPPFEADRRNDLDDEGNKIEEETVDECIDFGSRFNAETSGDRHQIEVDEVKTYSTEYGDNHRDKVHVSQLQMPFPSHSDTNSVLHRPPRHNLPFAARQVSIGETSVTLMTPMACSRSSTPEPLSDLDTVTGDEVLEKQSVYSEFSRVQSGLVTPSESEIPGSPCLMPKVQKRRILPALPVQRDVEISPPPSVPVLKEESIQTAPEVESEVSQRDMDDIKDFVSTVGGQSLKRKGRKPKPPPHNLVPSKFARPPAPPIVPPRVSDSVQPTRFFATNNSAGHIGFENDADDVVKTFASEGLSGATSISNLTISPISGISFPDNHGAFAASRPLPPIPPKPAGFLSGTATARMQFFAPQPSPQASPSSNPPPLPAKLSNQVSLTEINGNESEKSNEDRCAFKWPVPPAGEPPSASPSSSPNQTYQPLREAPSTSSPMSESVDNTRLDTKLVSLEELEEKSGAGEALEEPPPLPAPFHGNTNAGLPEKLPDELADMTEVLYGVLPKKRKGVKTTGPRAERKARIHNSLVSASSAKPIPEALPIPHSVSGTLPGSHEKKTPSTGTPRSRSSQAVGLVPAVSSLQSREKLASPELKKTQIVKTQPTNGAPTGGTSMWVDLDGDGTGMRGVNGTPKTAKENHTSSYMNRQLVGDLGGGDERETRASQTTLNGSNQQRAASPDISETLSQIDTNLSSHFSSEASDADDESPRRPKIVKPNIESGLHNGGGDNNSGRSPKPVKGGGKKSTSTASLSSKGLKPVNGRVESSEKVNEIPIRNIHPDELTGLRAPTRLVKQGTFIKENGPTSMAPPWIFPDTDLSKQMPAVRQRFQSLTRSPRESCSSANSLDRARVKSGGTAPRSRSGRSSSRPPLAVTSGVPNDVITVEQSSIGLAVTAGLNGSTKSLPKKSKPVTSKLASLWRGDKKAADKTNKNGGNVPEATWKKNGEASSESTPQIPIHSLTLAERLKPSRNLFGLAPRKSSTLPKKKSHSVGTVHTVPEPDNGSPKKVTSV